MRQNDATGGQNRLLTHPLISRWGPYSDVADYMGGFTFNGKPVEIDIIQNL